MICRLYEFFNLDVAGNGILTTQLDLNSSDTSKPNMDNGHIQGVSKNDYNALILFILKRSMPAETNVTVHQQINCIYF